MSKLSRYRVIANITPRPNDSEYSAAKRVADFLHADVKFIPPQHSKTPDLLIANQVWEIKSPRGSTPNTIIHQFQRASKQSCRLIFDTRLIKMSPEHCLARVKYYFKKSKTVKRLLYIDRKGRVSELFK